MFKGLLSWLQGGIPAHDGKVTFFWPCMQSLVLTKVVGAVLRRRPASPRHCALMRSARVSKGWRNQFVTTVIAS